MDRDKLRILANAARDEAAEWFKNFGEEVTAMVKEEAGWLYVLVTIRKLTRSLEGVPKRFNQVPVRLHVIN